MTGALVGDGLRNPGRPARHGRRGHRHGRRHLAACADRVEGDGADEPRKIIATFNQIIGAVRSTVPVEMWGEIVRKLDQVEQHSESLDVGTDAYDEADDAFDPIEFADEDDEF